MKIEQLIQKLGHDIKIQIYKVLLIQVKIIIYYNMNIKSFFYFLNYKEDT